MVYSTDSNVARIAGCIPDSSVDGPGIRWVVFFQGCAHACIGCHNPTTHAWDGDSSEDVPIEVLLAHFKDNAVANRVTISGGDPFFQPQALLTLVKGLRELCVDDIWIYTGFTYDALCNDEYCKAVLQYCDVVVVGPFVASLTEGAPLFAGSSNQELVYIKHAK